MFVVMEFVGKFEIIRVVVYVDVMVFDFKVIF